MREINKMNQDELIEYARELESGESGRSFEESAEYYRDNDDENIANVFDEMVNRWAVLESDTYKEQK